MRFAVVLLLGLLLLVTTTPAQDSENPSLEDVLRDAVQDFVDDRTGGDLGRIRGIEVVGKEAASVELEVEVSEVGSPEQATFTAYIYDRNLGKVREVQIDHKPLPAGSGPVSVRVTYTGDESLDSIGMALGLVDRDSGRTSSRRKVKFVHQWTGTGTGLSGSGASALATRGESSEELRETRTIALAPVVVGDTPSSGATTASSSTGGSPGGGSGGGSRGSGGVKPRVSDQGLRRADQGAMTRVTPPPPPSSTNRQPSSGSKERATSNPSAAAPSARFNAATARRFTNLQATSVDLYATASHARWASHEGSLPWNGGPGDRRGYVRDLGTEKLADGRSYAKVLQTHPAFIDSGHITGSYSIKIPSSATRFESKVGFLPGASASDGVVATVDLRGGPGMKTVVTRRITPSQGVTTLSGEIPKEWRGKDVTLRLYVRTYQHSKQDWFVWIAPKIR
jgi:hypothetical protein